MADEYKDIKDKKDKRDKRDNRGNRKGAYKKRRAAENKRNSEAADISVNDLEDAKEAESLGADYVFAGNIFETDCKKGLPGRGLEFLENVCEAVNIPVYAIGGISEEKMPQILGTGAAGGCMMSGFMQLKDHGNNR